MRFWLFSTILMVAVFLGSMLLGSISTLATTVGMYPCTNGSIDLMPIETGTLRSSPVFSLTTPTSSVYVSTEVMYSGSTNRLIDAALFAGTFKVNGFCNGSAYISQKG